MLRSIESKYKLIETLSVVLLSLATVLSSWCAYQSSQWGGEQYFRIDDETAANQADENGDNYMLLTVF